MADESENRSNQDDPQEIEDGIRALESEIRYLKGRKEQLEEAETLREYMGVYRSLRAYHEGDRPSETSNWTSVRLKDYFRREGVWNEDDRYPDSSMIDNAE